MKTCSRCKQIKPDESFRKLKNGHLYNHCWKCRREVNNISRRRYPHRVQADKMVYESMRGDPAIFAYLTAKHVEAYIGNAIERWERSYGMEAHPNLTAIRQLAADIAKETPPPEQGRSRRRCELCGNPYEPITKIQRFCCKAHASTEKERRRTARKRALRPPPLPKPPKPEPEPKYCAGCGTQLGKGRLKWCSDECRYVHYYAANRDVYIERAKASNHRRTERRNQRLKADAVR